MLHRQSSASVIAASSEPSPNNTVTVLDNTPPGEDISRNILPNGVYVEFNYKDQRNIRLLNQDLSLRKSFTIKTTAEKYPDEHFSLLAKGNLADEHYIFLEAMDMGHHHINTMQIWSTKDEPACVFDVSLERILPIPIVLSPTRVAYSDYKSITVLQLTKQGIRVELTADIKKASILGEIKGHLVLGINYYATHQLTLFNLVTHTTRLIRTFDFKTENPLLLSDSLVGFAQRDQQTLFQRIVFSDDMQSESCEAVFHTNLKLPDRPPHGSHSIKALPNDWLVIANPDGVSLWDPKNPRFIPQTLCTAHVKPSYGEGIFAASITIMESGKIHATTGTEEYELTVPEKLPQQTSEFFFPINKPLPNRVLTTQLLDSQRNPDERGSATEGNLDEFRRHNRGTGRMYVESKNVDTPPIDDAESTAEKRLITQENHLIVRAKYVPDEDMLSYISSKELIKVWDKNALRYTHRIEGTDVLLHAKNKIAVLTSDSIAIHDVTDSAITPEIFWERPTDFPVFIKFYGKTATHYILADAYGSLYGLDLATKKLLIINNDPSLVTALLPNGLIVGRSEHYDHSVDNLTLCVIAYDEEAEQFKKQAELLYHKKSARILDSLATLDNKLLLITRDKLLLWDPQYLGEAPQVIWTLPFLHNEDVAIYAKSLPDNRIQVRAIGQLFELNQLYLMRIVEHLQFAPSVYRGSLFSGPVASSTAALSEHQEESKAVADTTAGTRLDGRG
jgi:hypothetical protein